MDFIKLKVRIRDIHFEYNLKGLNAKTTICEYSEFLFKAIAHPSMEQDKTFSVI